MRGGMRKITNLEKGQRQIGNYSKQGKQKERGRAERHHGGRETGKEMEIWLRLKTFAAECTCLQMLIFFKIPTFLLHNYI